MAKYLCRNWWEGQATHLKITLELQLIYSLENFAKKGLHPERIFRLRQDLEQLIV